MKTIEEISYEGYEGITGVIESKGNTREVDVSSWRIETPVIDVKKCVFCGRCVMFCPEDAIEMFRDKKEIKINYRSCKGCLVCEEVCPVKAISHENS